MRFTQKGADKLCAVCICVCKLITWFWILAWFYQKHVIVLKHKSCIGPILYFLLNLPSSTHSSSLDEIRWLYILETILVTGFCHMEPVLFENEVTVLLKQAPELFSDSGYCSSWAGSHDRWLHWFPRSSNCLMWRLSSFMFLVLLCLQKFG